MEQGNPICHKCKEEITGEECAAVEGLKFHVEHFTCEECGNSLGGKPYIPHEDHFYCEDDYYKLHGPKCAKC